MSDQAQYLINPCERQAMHINVDPRVVQMLEELHVIEVQRQGKRRYGVRTLTGLINMLLWQEVKRQLPDNRDPHMRGDEPEQQTPP